MDTVLEQQGLSHDTAIRRTPGLRRLFLTRALAFCEYLAVRAVAGLFGVGVAIRYLRNPNPRVTVRLLRAFGAVVGDDTTVKGSVFIDNVQGDANATGDFTHLQIGNRCYIGDCVFLDLANDIVIEDDAVVAGRVSLLTHAECSRSTFLAARFPRRCSPVTVGSGAWVGFGATVLAGVIIGPNSVIGAESLVRRDVEANCVYAGSPATKLRCIR
jgi:acetyltransferase-like isoleucine patch superfamily enzyme